MSTARIPDGTPLGLVQVGLSATQAQSMPGRSDPPVKPTSEVAHQPGQQPAKTLCGATDRFSESGRIHGRCNLAAGHASDWHQEWRGTRLWAEWRGPHPGQRCSICGKDGSEH